MEESTVDEDRISVHSTDDTRRSPVRHERDNISPLESGLRSDTIPQNNSFVSSSSGHNQFEQPEVIYNMYLHMHVCTYVYIVYKYPKA